MATLPRAHAIEVLLHADLATARRETFDTIGVLEPVGDGTVLFAQADDLDWFARELSRLPFGFEVRHPPRCASHCATTPTACSISQCRSAPWARWRQRGGPRVLGAPLQTPV